MLTTDRSEPEGFGVVPSKVWARIDALLRRLEKVLPGDEPDWACGAVAYRWRRQTSFWGSAGVLTPILAHSSIELADLLHVDEAKQRVCMNTEQFLRGLPANHVLLTGARGTGKSSLVKACLNAYAQQGLRLIEVDKADLADLDLIVTQVVQRPEKFIVFCDDLSFEAHESGYKALKVALDGSVSATQRVLVYATSNRRHLMPEQMADNLSATHTDTGDIHPAETSEEKNALAERFGVWIPFYPLSQNEYLAVVAHGLARLGAISLTDPARVAALRWALERGSRSARVAAQFARAWVGRQALAQL